MEGVRKHRPSMRAWMRFNHHRLLEPLGLPSPSGVRGAICFPSGRPGCGLSKTTESPGNPGRFNCAIICKLGLKSTLPTSCLDVTLDRLQMRSISRS